MGKVISSLSVALGASIAPLQKSFGTLAGTVESAKSSFGSIGGTLLGMTGAGAAFAAGMGAIKGVFGGIGDSISLASTLEQNQVAFETMTGSGEKAAALMKDIGAFAAETPFEFPELASSAKKLLAFGTSADQIVPTMRALGDISSGIGAPLNEIAELFGKAKVQGTLMSEDINQLVGRGIPVIQQFAKQLGVGEGQVKKMASEGKISFDMLQQAVIDMTGAGGQFSGMMAKQSTTLGGLWSTFSDGISMTMAGIVQKIVDAFHLKGALTSLIGFTSSVGDKLLGLVDTVAPIVMGVGGTIYNAVAGFMGQISGVLATNWQDIVDTAVQYWTSLYGYITAVGTALWTAITGIASGISNLWAGAMNLLGVETSNASITVGSATQGIVDAWKWLMDNVTLAVNVVSFGISNFSTILAAAMVASAYEIVKFGNQVTYVFVDVIGGYLAWFGRNWKQIFTDVVTYTGTVFTNLAKNAGNFFAALWSAIKGEGFNFQWTGLTEGFKATLSELPVIAERQTGALENSLKDQSDALNKSLATGLGEYLNAQDAKAKEVADAAKKRLAGMFGGTGPDAPKPPDLKMRVDNKQANAAIEQTKQKAGDLKTIFAGSAEALQTQAMAKFGATGTSGGTGTPASNSVPNWQDKPGSANDAPTKASIDGLVAQATQMLTVLQTIATNTGKKGQQFGVATP